MRSTHILSKQERFLLLLRQAQIPEETIQSYLNQGHIDKLQIIRAEQKWVFHFVLPEIIPPSIYQLLTSQIQNQFAHLANIDIHIRFGSDFDPHAFFDQYWSFFLEQHGSKLNGLLKRLQSQPPVCDQRTVAFTVANEFEQNIFQKKLEPMLRSFFSQFFDWNWTCTYTLQESDEEYRHFIEAREKEEQERAQQTLRERQEEINQGSIRSKKSARHLLVGSQIKDESILIEHIQEEERNICIEGQVFQVDIRQLKSGRSLLIVNITDYSDSITVKMFSKDENDVEAFQTIDKGMWLKVRGSVQTDTFQRELVLMAVDINRIKKQEREDSSVDKRTELHLHTNMSTMDATTPISDYVAQAAKWGHPALAVTDHGVAQAFPEAYAAGQKHGIKIIYGLEANLVDDGVPIVYGHENRPLSEETYIVFDVETTGLSAVYNTIIELAAVKIHQGKVVDRFESFVNPHEAISAQISQLTGITDDMVADAPDADVVLRDFLDFIDQHTLVAHNASFDMGFLRMGYKRINIELQNPVVDTLEMARFLYPELKNHRLNTLCKKMNIELLNHHRAVDDATATGELFWKMIIDASEREIFHSQELNRQKEKNTNYQRVRPTHCTILAQNQMGLKNLYRLISLSHTEYFHRVPRIPRSILEQNREGLLVGSGCDKGEVFEAVLQKSPEEAEEIAQFYDYLEIQPTQCYEHLRKRELVKSTKHIQQILANIVGIGKKLDKRVVATGNVHYLHPEHAVTREILITTLGGASPLDPNHLPPVHFRSTDEMLEEFQFLGESVAREVVIDHPNQVQTEIEEIQPIPDQLYTPRIEGADEEIRQMSYEKAKSIYGEPLPSIVEERLEKELDSIIGHGFAVIYLISHKLVSKSLEDGYLVGSRGSVGSSFVATMTNITEVNPLPPHYVCLDCHYSQFFEDGSVGSGYDLPDQNCPQCGKPMNKDGHHIPFETFLGFKGDKVPDIDLNFSGEYQPIAHKYTQELFGEENVYRAGTIGTVADKTAYGFVKKYEEVTGSIFRQAEIGRLASGCSGVKRTTGQHPGGIIVVPDDRDIYDFTPIQYPADDLKSEWRTTHFDFHSIHDNLLKLDILGHDDPTVLRMLQDLSGIDQHTIPLDDPEVMKIFSSTESLGVTQEEIMSPTGSLGIPEFGTRFVRQMLDDTKPTTFAELVRISGLSHGTDVWLNNAQELIRNKKAVLAEVISTRDDIMVYLIQKGLDSSRAFNIMERVRKGKGLEEEDIEYMKEHGVPDWYIWSCLQIKYMFPKAHAAAYVLMAVRIAYFKVYHPIFFYASYFTVRADDFDIDLAVKGSDAIRTKIKEILEKGNQAQPKEKSLLTVLELCLEMVARGYSFQKVDLYRSHANKFLVEDQTLIPPFNAIPGVGTNAAMNIMHARSKGEFLSIEDLQTRSKISKTVVEFLQEQGCLEDLPESNQLSLF